jgi:hypothetical protein
LKNLPHFAKKCGSAILLFFKFLLFLFFKVLLIFKDFYFYFFYSDMCQLLLVNT